MSSKALLVGGDMIYAPLRQDKSLHGIKAFLGAAGYADTQFGGTWRIPGSTAVAGTPDVPVGRRVALLHERLLRIARTTWSDPETGAYIFNNVSRGPWSVVSYDHTGEYNAVIGSNVPVEPM